MMVSFFRPSAARNRILIEYSAFPSDRYAVVSQLESHGLPASSLVEIAPRDGERTLRHEDLLQAIERHGDSLAMVLLPGVQYLTGQTLDIRALTAAAQRAGATIGWDLAHAIGNVPLSLHEDGADFAVWCSYKYLNAGPGAIGGAFVHARHARRGDLPRFAGWWGHDKAERFLFASRFRPIPGAEGWQVSNPPILSSAALLVSLELFAAAGLPALRDKSLALTDVLRRLLETRLAAHLDILTPAAPAQHGSQLSLRLRRDPAAARRCQASLTASGLVADWREPDVVRLAPVPLYNSFRDVYQAVAALEEALQA
jgi:kynureninase